MADLTDAGKNHNSAAEIKKLEAEIAKGKRSHEAQAEAFKSNKKGKDESPK